jgi:DNA-binding IclR family transcriptional regulator
MSSLEKALAILDLYSSQVAEVGVSEAARQIKIPKSSASRLMAAMAQQGMLEMEATTRRYRPGFLAFRLGSLYQSHTSLVDLADQAVGELAERFGITGYVSLLDKTNVIVLRMRHGQSPLRTIISEPGSREPAFNTAAGRALLARADETSVASLVSTYYQSAGNRRVRAIEFMKMLEKIRSRGWADADHYDGQIGAIAAAVVPEDTKVRPVALSLSFPKASVDHARQVRMISDLGRCVAALSQRFSDDARAIGKASDAGALGDPVRRTAGMRLKTGRIASSGRGTDSRHE